MMKKKINNRLLIDKKYQKLVNEIKRHNRDISIEKKEFYETIKKIVKMRKKFEKQLVQLKKWLHLGRVNPSLTKKLSLFGLGIAVGLTWMIAIIFAGTFAMHILKDGY